MGEEGGRKRNWNGKGGKGRGQSLQIFQPKTGPGRVWRSGVNWLVVDGMLCVCATSIYHAVEPGTDYHWCAINDPCGQGGSASQQYYPLYSTTCTRVAHQPVPVPCSQSTVQYNSTTRTPSPASTSSVVCTDPATRKTVIRVSSGTSRVSSACVFSDSASGYSNQGRAN